VFDEFITKAVSMDTKLLELFANRVIERKNMINDYLRGGLSFRVLGGVDFRGVLILSLCFNLELFLLF
jgi:hypothetical protein